METEFKISPNILEHLGIATYTSLNKSISELCSNSYDADADNVWIEIPDEFFKNSQIVLKDDGSGMSSDDIINRYLFIGYNRRVKGELSQIKNRLIIGNKGIGKLAGFGIANTIELVSIKDKIKSILVINKDIFSDFANLNDYKLDIKTIDTDEPDGTTLTLQQLKINRKYYDLNNLRQYLFNTLPTVPDFTIKVNNIPCSAEDVQGQKVAINHEFKDIGNIKGFYTIANVRQKQPGIIIRVRKRAVTKPSLFGVEKRSHFSFSTEKIVGEIEADFLDPFINTSRDDFLSDSDEVNIVNDYLKEYFEQIIDEIEKDAEGIRASRFIERSDVQDRLLILPIQIRAKARLVIEGAISKLKLSTDEDVDELVDWIFRYYESNVLREIMASIMKAEIKDVEKLSELINDWGVKQITNVSRIIRDQIEIILKLEELVESEKSKEIELHKLIESNLWLVREGLELWASDKPLKKVLEKHFDKIYKNNASERPDLICRSRDGGFDAVILEFKRPSVKVQMKHVTQALSYEGIIKKHRPNLNFETFVVGRNYSPDVMASKEKLSKGGLYLWSFGEILQKSRARFEKILEILNA